MIRAMHVLNGGALPSTAPPSPGAGQSSPSVRSQVVSTRPAATNDKDWLVILLLVAIVVFFERNS